eukprot:TRINITY_DN1770_c0_g1_i1.p1 TRINITY_DN1770_c0_g1~~TRINITY_DN1770_c0_g1_i1.p1  ORF type:complete len:443 (-),score=98.33 TRINITY_DN1770_c0_g1_i1:394-1722(-)
MNSAVGLVAFLVCVAFGQTCGCMVTLQTFANSRCDGPATHNWTFVANGKCYFDETEGERIVAKIVDDVLTVTSYEADSKTCDSSSVSAEPTHFTRGRCTDLGGELSASPTWSIDADGCGGNKAGTEQNVQLPERPFADPVELRAAFEIWVAMHDKVYKSDAEYASRMAAFNESLVRIELQNANSPKGGARFALNKFSDMTPKEFRSVILMTDVPPKKGKLRVARPPPGFVEAPSSWDWRQKNAVTPVKDQGQCGSCWAFSATETIESAWILAGNPQKILAPQQIVDCDTNDGGCNGGQPTSAFKYVQGAGGQELESSYPYQGTQGNCQFDKSKVVATVGGVQRAVGGPRSAAGRLRHHPEPAVLDRSQLVEHQLGHQRLHLSRDVAEHLPADDGHVTVQGRRPARHRHLHLVLGVLRFFGFVGLLRLQQFRVEQFCLQQLRL